MPVVSLTLDDVNKTILEPIYNKIVNDVNAAVKLPSNIMVILHKDIDISRTDNSISSTSNNLPNLPTTSSERRVIASVTEEYNEDVLSSTSVNECNAYPIFKDADINAYVYPIYIKTDVNIEFSYICSSKAEAKRVRDDIKLRLSQTRNILHHEVDYEILLPSVVDEFIGDLYDLKSRLFPMELKDYVYAYTTKRLHVITDMANKENVKLAVYERQVRVVGVFDLSPLPDKIEIDNENNNYKLVFNYKLSLDVPKAIALRYPVMVCNRQMKDKYVSFIEESKLNSKEEIYQKYNIPFNRRGLYYFEAHQQLSNRMDMKVPINVPLFDDFNIRQGHPGYGHVASFLVEIDEIDKKSLLNLKDLGNYMLPDALIQFLINGERAFVTNLYKSFIFISLYQDEVHFDNPILEVDQNLNVKSTKELGLVKPTRVVISFITNIEYLDTEALDRILSNLDVLYLFLREYMYMYNTFRAEIHKHKYGDISFYKFFLYILDYFIKRDNTTALGNILSVFREDDRIFNNLGSILYNDFPDNFNYLVTNRLLDSNINLHNSVNYTANGYGTMKTVMNNSILALNSN